MISFRLQLSVLVAGTLFLGSLALGGCNYSTSTPSGEQAEKRAATGSPAESKPGTTLPTDAVAVVDGIPITQEEFDLTVSQFESMDPEQFQNLSPEDREKLLSRILDQMIMVRVQVQEAQRRGLQVPQELVEQEYEAFKADFTSEEIFLDALQKAKTSPQIWKKGMWEALMMRKLEEMMTSRLEVNPEEIEGYWSANKQSLQRDMVHIRQVLVRTEHEAKKVLAALERGMSFEAQVREYSVDPLTKAKGGDLGWISRGEAFEEFERVVFSLKPQSVSTPLKGKYGYHIVQVLEKKAASQTSLSDHREKIRGLIQQQKWQAQRASWLQTIKAQVTIQESSVSN